MVTQNTELWVDAKSAYEVCSVASAAPSVTFVIAAENASDFAREKERYEGQDRWSISR